MTPQLRYVLRLADSSLVLAQRLGEWVGHAPALEEDLGLANVSLDLLGQARLLLAHAGELEGRGRGEDQLAYLRGESEYFNLTLVEQPNGDFGQTIARQFLFDAWQLGMYEAMQQSADARLAAIAAKALKETRYHLRYSGGWLIRLGDGTEESRRRTQQALERLWPFVNELFATDDVDREAARAGIGPEPGTLESGWTQRVDEVLAQATLAPPARAHFVWYGKQGRHGEHLGYLLAEMQSLHRAHPGANW
ncbi:MAG: phenylacetate-CoA oxygenase subunit PaaC [Steroidobacteraceae bacterium]|nr:phenylacetate-CoA oxygenase subunit PaaC [Steroidobacteraceae bacterium]